jgi:hypothetical protein
LWKESTHQQISFLSRHTKINRPGTRTKRDKPEKQATLELFVAEKRPMRSQKMPASGFGTCFGQPWAKPQLRLV